MGYNENCYNHLQESRKQARKYGGWTDKEIWRTTSMYVDRNTGEIIEEEKSKGIELKSFDETWELREIPPEGVIIQRSLNRIVEGTDPGNMTGQSVRVKNIEMSIEVFMEPHDWPIIGNAIEDVRQYTNVRIIVVEARS